MAMLRSYNTATRQSAIDAGADQAKAERGEPRYTRRPRLNWRASQLRGPPPKLKPKLTVCY